MNLSLFDVLLLLFLVVILVSVVYILYPYQSSSKETTYHLILIIITLWLLISMLLLVHIVFLTPRLLENVLARGQGRYYQNLLTIMDQVVKYYILLDIFISISIFHLLFVVLRKYRLLTEELRVINLLMLFHKMRVLNLLF